MSKRLPYAIRAKAEALAREKDLTFTTALRWLAKSSQTKQRTRRQRLTAHVSFLEQQKLF